MKFMRMHIRVVDEETGIELPNSLVTVSTSPYTSDGRLLWIGWSPTTTTDISPQPVYVTGIRPVGEDEIPGIRPSLYAGSVYMPGIAEQITIRIRRTGGLPPWWYTDASQGKLTVKYNNNFASNLSVGEVQSLLEKGYRVYLGARLRIRIAPTTRAGFTSPSGSQFCRWLSDIKVTAIPRSGWYFLLWQLDGLLKRDNPITIHMDRNYTLTAYFTTTPPPPPPTPPTTYTLTVAVNNPDMGTTNTQYPPGTYTITENTPITVSAIPKTGFKFNNWTLNDQVKTENPISFIMDKNYTLTAYFSEEPAPPPPTPPPPESPEPTPTPPSWPPIISILGPLTLGLTAYTLSTLK
jgi:hypothetical protein